ncbi:translation repressor RelB [Bifidobacterium bifidum]|uniref:type II toxin-antitoxin system RelB/DinJ family antitoxin n=1 Tax=Bifidobacterium bifidum TaxID=1681 RepID=UPI000E229B29|nr:type II toxin-antitoxin system RelB/DinJ family antitoxin [Bifidobacterium bifidum]AXM92204.1 translation repressor RelB [Bifidobacterium bifidum]
MSTTTVRMDDDLKAEVNAILDSMGLNFNTFVNMASVQLVSQRRIPFEVKAPEPVLPHVGHVAANGVTYRGVDEQGYPAVEVPNDMVLNPSRGADGVAVLPKAWRDGE